MSDDDDIDWDALSQAEFALKMLEKIAAEPAAITPEQAELIEKRAQADGVTRRCVLAALTRPGKHMLECVARDRATAVAFADIQSCIREYLSRHDSLREFYETVDTWIMMALAQREDMAEVIKEATGVDIPRIDH